MTTKNRYIDGIHTYSGKKRKRYYSTTKRHAKWTEHKEGCRIRLVKFPQRRTATNTPDDRNMTEERKETKQEVNKDLLYGEDTFKMSEREYDEKRDPGEQNIPE